MKRLVGLAVAVAILIAALSSHGKSTTSTVASSEPATSLPTTAARPAPHPRHRPPGGHYKPCDQNISVGPDTTCAFADNVFRAFASEAENGSEEATVTADSPVTHKSYVMACHTSDGTTLCTGGNSARVRFPLWAAQVYNQPSEPEAESGGEAPEGEAEPKGGGGEECTSGSYENSSGNIVCSPEESESEPAGATARCNDGTWSFSEHHSGTCSSHGGVREWL
jgi:hypothetical protein